MLHSPNTTLEVFIASPQAIYGGLPRVEVAVVELLLLVRVDGDNRLGLHQKGGSKIEDQNRPEPGEKKQRNGNRPGPEHGEIKVLGNAPAYPEDHAMTRTI